MSRRANHEGSIRQRDEGVWEASITFEIVRNYLEPAFGRRKLQSLTPSDIARQYGRWRDAGVGARTLAIIHARLHRALRQAVLWGHIARNPADAVEPPRSEYRRPKLWAVDEAASFAAHLAGDTWADPLAALQIGGGLRLGEACGLRWDDLDGTAVHIERTRALIRREWLEGSTKTGAGTRTVVLPSFTLAVLRHWRAVQAAQRLVAGSGWTGDNRIVTLPDGRTPGRWQAGEAMRKRASALGLPALRPHDLRHLHASLLLAEGLPVPAVAARLGHASPAVTMTVYAHALKGQDDVAARAVEGALGRATG